MPHLVMPNFQPTAVAFPTRSTSATQTSEAREVGEEMEINFCRMDIDISTKVQEEPGSEP
jgi:hypothetical protein